MTASGSFPTDAQAPGVKGTRCWALLGQREGVAVFMGLGDSVQNLQWEHLGTERAQSPILLHQCRYPYDAVILSSPSDSGILGHPVMAEYGGSTPKGPWIGTI